MGTKFLDRLAQEIVYNMLVGLSIRLPGFKVDRVPGNSMESKPIEEKKITRFYDNLPLTREDQSPLRPISIKCASEFWFITSCPLTVGINSVVFYSILAEQPEMIDWILCYAL